MNLDLENSTTGYNVDGIDAPSSQRPYKPPQVIDTITFRIFLLFSILITVIDRDPTLAESDLAKHYRTYIKIKFLCFVMDTHIKSKYKPILRTYFEFSWFETNREPLKNFYYSLRSRVHRKLYARKTNKH